MGLALKDRKVRLKIKLAASVISNAEGFRKKTNERGQQERSI